MAFLITRRLSQKLYSSAWRAICSTPDKPYWSSKFPDGPKSFDEMPVIEEKNYDICTMKDIFVQFFEKYGYVSKEKMPDNTWLVHLYHFHDFKTVYFNDATFPVQMRHYWEEEENDLYDGTLKDGFGEEWSLLKSLMPHGVSDANFRPLQPELEAVTDFLVDMLHLESKDGVVNIYPFLFHWALESTGVIALNLRLNALSEAITDEAETMVETAATTNEMIALYEADYLNHQKHYKTLLKRQNNMLKCLVCYVDPNILQETESLGKTLLVKSKSIKNVQSLLLAIFQGAMQTVPVTVLMALYHLAVNKDVQEAARKVVMEVLPSSNSRYFDAVTKDKDSIPPYLDAVIWETLRVSPPMIGNVRVTQDDLTLGGYLVPKGTNTLLHHEVAGHLEENFEEPLKFKPERHPTIHQQYLEYMFGARERACLGKTLYQVQMSLVIAKILRNFEISYDGADINIIDRLVKEPEEPLNFGLKPLV